MNIYINNVTKNYDNKTLIITDENWSNVVFNPGLKRLSDYNSLLKTY